MHRHDVNGVHLGWLAVADAPPAADLLEQLSDTERARYTSMVDRTQADRFVLGRVALRALASDLTGHAAVTVRARCSRCGGPHGRPVLGGSPELDRMHSSIAHSTDVVVVVVSAEVPVGVDVEPLEGAADRASGIGTLLPSPRRLTVSGALREWTRIEAVLKADGRGLLVDPALVGLQPSGYGFVARIADEPTAYRVVDVDLDPSSIVAVARLVPPQGRVGKGPL